ncbi:NUDIX hydrolase [Paenibacillus ginsengarvi]|uniref:NUDIX hydrolase n=1 Tax=Paenibacillus ginsengarvi TaxID=400777 RepID=A0A3B0CE27_9BACL|nr:NUDIX hydrolase [Paenibacillus ginsengarvi]RKN82027.1 NUDIX hydrolase [Paenibacillus ginsengarvi]
MSIRVRVTCICIRDGKIVLMKKLVPSYVTYNQLTPPGGGVEFQETLEQACIREMDEETGLIVRNPQMTGVETSMSRRDGAHTVTFYFVTDEVNGELLVKEPHKHIPYWVELDELPSHASVPEYYKEIMARAIQRGAFFNARVKFLEPEGKVVWSL